MADKVKTKKPMIKVEEIEDDAVTEEVKEPKVTESETPKETPESSSTAPAVSSFSQLDSAPPAPAEEKKSILTDTSDKSMVEDIAPEPVSKTESEPTPEPEKREEELLDKEKISSDEVKEWLKDVRPDTSKEIEKSRGPGGKIVVIIVLILLVLGAIVGGILYFQKGVSEPVSEVSETQTSETAEVTTPEPTQEAEVDLSIITFSVLNGSGIAGEAGKVKDLLVEGGFSEDKIQAGNADKYDYQDISLSLKSGLSEKVNEAITASLSDVYDVTVSEDNLQENSTYDVVIIVGK